MQSKKMRIGPEYPDSWWDENNPDGDCPECGGQCDGGVCGRHAAGCIFGGSPGGYWLIAEGCRLFHGENTGESDGS